MATRFWPQRPALDLASYGLPAAMLARFSSASTSILLTRQYLASSSPAVDIALWWCGDDALAEVHVVSRARSEQDGELVRTGPVAPAAIEDLKASLRGAGLGLVPRIVVAEGRSTGGVIDVFEVKDQHHVGGRCIVHGRSTGDRRVSAILALLVGDSGLREVRARHDARRARTSSPQTSPTARRSRIARALPSLAERSRIEIERDRRSLNVSLLMADHPGVLALVGDEPMYLSPDGAAALMDDRNDVISRWCRRRGRAYASVAEARFVLFGIDVGA